MTAYTVWNNSIPAGTTSAAVSARTSGLQFSVSSDCTLTGIAFYVPAGETNLAGSNYVALLYTTTTGNSGTQVVSQAGSGTFTAGAWNWITVSYSLVTGTTYVAAVSSPDDLQYEHTYWSSGAGVGGVTSGPITVPDESSALDHVQQGEANAAATFPGTNSASSWYGVDIQVTTGGTPHTATAALTVTPTFSAGRTRGKYRTGALTVTPAFSAPRTRGKYRSGSLLITPSFTATRLHTRSRTAGLIVVPEFTAAAGAPPRLDPGLLAGVITGDLMAGVITTDDYAGVIT